MLPLQFFGQNLHFAINLFTALVFFAMFWLYLDAWSVRKAAKELYKWTGCLLLSFGFLISGSVIDGLADQHVLGDKAIMLILILQLAGYAALIYGQLIDPLQEVPHTTGIQPKSSAKQSKKAPLLFSTAGAIQFLIPIGAAFTAYLYWRRATVGLERHLKPVAIGFGLTALSHLVSVAGIAQSSTNPVIYRLVAPYGWLWWLAHTLLLAGALVLAGWVWRYLVKRIFSQLFMIFTSMAVAIFLVTAIGFSFLLGNSVQTDTLNSLEKANNSLTYAIDSKKLETLAHSEVIANNPDVARAVSNKDHDELVKLTSGYLESKKLSSMLITTSAGQVLLRAEDPNRWGDSVSEDPLIQRAANGLTTSSAVGQQDVLVPLIYFYSSVPIKNTSGKVVGVVRSGLIADTAFVDGIKQATGVDASIYSGDIRSATTLVAPDGKSRLIGVKENNKQVSSQVIGQGEVFKGLTSLQNESYLAVYAPLKSHTEKTEGMLLISIPHASILETAGKSLQLTFLMATLMVLLSVLPIYFIAKHLTNQVS